MSQYMNQTVRFPEVKCWEQKTVKCSVCGKRLRREKTFTATINPFNVNEDGSQKTATQIREKLGLDAAAWKKEPETCRECAK